MEKRILAKCGKKKVNCNRKKAPFGTESGAILAAAGINAAATAAASITSANATKDAARSQANATITAAQKQAQAIKDQTTRAKEYQMQSQEFIKEQNAESRELQKDIQMQLQMLTGQQNVNDRLEASKLVVKNGGVKIPKFSLRWNNMSFTNPFTVPFKASYNMPFKVTDGGFALPVLRTPEGFNMFELYGNDHEHYHKAPGGKYKSGVGIKFKDGTIVEGEGNQNTKQGEYLLNTPWANYFISKNTLAGLFNPAKAVNGGMHPLEAFNLQEYIKSIFNISDDGKHNGVLAKNYNNSLVGKRMAFAGTGVSNIYDMYNQTTPKLETDTIGDTAVGVAYASQDKNQMKCGGKKRTLKCGGKVRQKAYDGHLKLFIPSYNFNLNNGFTSVESIGQNRLNSTLTKPSSRYSNSKPVTTNPVTTRSSGSFWNNIGADLMGAGISSLGNIGGAWITSNANRHAANKLAEAYNTSAGILADAYRSLQTIDPSSIKREDYATAHVMPALQAPISLAAPQIAPVNRQLQRRLYNAGKYSASSAAAQNIMTSAEIDAQDIKNKIYSTDQEQMQKIRQDNANRVTQAAMQNAQLDTEANKQYANAYLNLLQYNNDIENQKILGSAGALSEGSINAASAMANAHTANATAWNNAIVNSGQSFANTLSSMATRKADLEKVMLGASGDARSIYYANSGSYNDAKNYYNNLVRQYDLIKNSTKPEDQDTKTYLKRLINTVGTGRNFDTV